MQLSSEMGGVPQALAQAASIIRRQQIGFAECLERYRDVEERPEFHASEGTGRFKGPRGTVAQLFAAAQSSMSPP